MEPITLTPAVAAKFLQHLTGQEKSRSTRQQYWRSAAAFAKFAGGRPVTKALVLQYKAALQQRYAARSVNAALAALNCLFSFLGQPGLRCKSVKLQRQIYCPEEKELTKQEYERLCRAALLQKNNRLYLLLQTVCGTGIRVSELPFITVQAAKSGQATVRCKGKTRTVFFPLYGGRFLTGFCQPKLKAYLKLQISGTCLWLKVPQSLNAFGGVS